MRRRSLPPLPARGEKGRGAAITTRRALLRRQRGAGVSDQRNRLLGRIGLTRADAPGRARPGGVTDGAADDVDVQLSDDIAEGANVELVDVWQLAEERGGGGDLLDQNRAVFRRQIDDLA